MKPSSAFDPIRNKTTKIEKPTLVAPDLIYENRVLDKPVSPNDIALSAFNSLQSFLVQEHKLILPQKPTSQACRSSQQVHKESQAEDLATQFTQQIEQIKTAGYDYEEGQQNFDERYDTKSKQVAEWEFYVKSDVRATESFYHFINAFRVNPQTGHIQVEAIAYDPMRDSEIQVNQTYPVRWADAIVHQFSVLIQHRLPPDVDWNMESIRAQKIPTSSVTLPSIPLGERLILKPGEQAFYAFLLEQPGALRTSALHTPGKKLDAVYITKGKIEGFYEEVVISFMPDKGQEES